MPVVTRGALARQRREWLRVTSLGRDWVATHGMCCDARGGCRGASPGPDAWHAAAVQQTAVAASHACAILRSGWCTVDMLRRAMEYTCARWPQRTEAAYAAGAMQDVVEELRRRGVVERSAAAPDDGDEVCAITRERLMSLPLDLIDRLPACGHAVEHRALLAWMRACDARGGPRKCPACGTPLEPRPPRLTPLGRTWRVAQLCLWLPLIAVMLLTGAVVLAALAPAIACERLLRRCLGRPVLPESVRPLATVALVACAAYACAPTTTAAVAVMAAFLAALAWWSSDQSERFWDAMDAKFNH